MSTPLKALLVMLLAWPISECAFDFVQGRRRR